MLTGIPTFEEYVSSLGHLTPHVDPTLSSQDAIDIKEAAASLRALDEISATTVAEWAASHPAWVLALGLTAGLSQEKLRNALKHRFNTSGWYSLARERPAELIEMLDADYDLLRLVEIQRAARLRGLLSLS